MNCCISVSKSAVVSTTVAAVCSLKSGISSLSEAPSASKPSISQSRVIANSSLSGLIGGGVGDGDSGGFRSLSNSFCAFKSSSFYTSLQSQQAIQMPLASNETCKKSRSGVGVSQRVSQPTKRCQGGRR